MTEHLYVKLSKKEFDEIFSKLKSLVYSYNADLKGTGLYLKPFHIVYKSNGKQYIYIGKYWYYLEYKDGKVKWYYLGTEKPLDKLPDPPAIPNVTIIKKGDDYYITPLDLDRLKLFLQKAQVS